LTRYLQLFKLTGILHGENLYNNYVTCKGKYVLAMKINTLDYEIIMDNSEKYILLENAFEQHFSGAKAKNLGEIIRLGIPVPKGFVLVGKVLEEFLHDQQLDSSLLFINQIPESKLSHDTNEIRTRLKEGRISDELLTAITLRIKNVIGNGAVIVRSSAIGEDSIEASFAGQLDSVVVKDIKTELENAILQCWASYWHKHNIAYQFNRNCFLQGMGIVVQELIDSAISGVVFTGNVAGQKDEEHLIAEFCFGMGDKLADGTISPGRIEISRDGDSWDIAALPSDHGSAESNHAHDFSWVATLAQYAVRLEQYFSCRQDIEWTVDRSGNLFILQARPITTKKPRKFVWSNANMNENYPVPVCPLLGSIAERSYYHYFRNLARSFGIPERYLKKTEHALSQTVGIQGGRLYYNVTNIYTIIRLMPFSDELIKGWDSFIGIYENQEEESDKKLLRLNVISKYKFFLQVVCKTLWTYTFMHLRVAKFVHQVDEHVRRYRKSGNFTTENVSTEKSFAAEKELSELKTAFENFFTIRFHHWKNAALADAAALITYRLLKKTLNSWIPENTGIRQNVLLKGSPNMISAKPSQNLWELAEYVKNSPPLRKLFRHSDKKIINSIRTVAQYSDFNQLLEAYLQNWGFRCSGELMLTTSNYQEEPDRLIALMKRYLELSAVKPNEQLEKQVISYTEEKEKMILALKKGKSKMPFSLRKCLLLGILWMTHKSIFYRELVRFKQAHLYSIFRQTILRIGDLMTKHSLVKHNEDVFYLKYPEVQELLDNPPKEKNENLHLTVDERKVKQEQFMQMELPTTLILNDGEDFAPEFAISNNKTPDERTAVENYIVGIPASPGKVRGAARKLSSVFESNKIKSGEILVTRQTDPGWGPIFPLIKGLVLERGGMLSHGAIIAREFGIPAVVDVRGADARIDNDQIIFVNGDDGKVSF